MTKYLLLFSYFNITQGMPYTKLVQKPPILPSLKLRELIGLIHLLMSLFTPLHLSVSLTWTNMLLVNVTMEGGRGRRGGISVTPLCLSISQTWTNMELVNVTMEGAGFLDQFSVRRRQLYICLPDIMPTKMAQSLTTLLCPTPHLPFNNLHLTT